MPPEPNKMTITPLMPVYPRSPVRPVRGEGVWLSGEGGEKYIDFASGVAVTSLGHCHPAIVKALTEQAQTLWHVSNWMTNEAALRLAKKLVDATFAERVFFCNSGAEANEAALKLARRYAHDHFGAEKFRVISTLNAFHGRTLFTVTAGGQAKYASGFGPTPTGFTHIRYNDIAGLEAAFAEENLGRNESATLNGLDRDAVELDGARDGGERERQKTFLERIAEHEQIGGDGIAHQRRRDHAAGDRRGGRHEPAQLSHRAIAARIVAMHTRAFAPGRAADAVQDREGHIRGLRKRERERETGTCAQLAELDRRGTAMLRLEAGENRRYRTRWPPL